jgi:hypothetical protein
MANKFTRFLNTLPRGPKGVVGNFRHAERIFVDNYYRLAPRTKFLYYVVFRGAEREISLLVKTAELPKFTFDSVTKNVYNRTKHVYKKMNYDPITFTFHDDNQGLVNQMWNEYYSYYSDDPGGTQLLHPNSLVNYRSSYGMGFPVNENYFQKISLYTMSRQRFNGYELLAPRIKSWTHTDLSYDGNEVAQNTMTIDYEGVVYSNGSVTYGSPDGFASLSYDVVKSPLTLGGGGLRGIADALGGSIVSDITSIFGDVSLKNIKKRPGAFVSAAIQAVNNYQRYNPGAGQSFSGIVGELSNPAAAAGAANIVGGVIGTKFPKVGTELGSLAATVAVNKLLQPKAAPNTFPQSTGNQSKPRTRP